MIPAETALAAIIVTLSLIAVGLVGYTAWTLRRLSRRGPESDPDSWLGGRANPKDGPPRP